jgi:NADH-quinone oxidoreductase subunit J
VVLLVFGVMLTASGPYTTIKTSPAEGIIGAAVGLMLLMVLVSSIGKVDWDAISRRLPSSPESPSAADTHAKESLVNSGSTKAKTDLVAIQQQGRTVRQLGLSFLGLRPDRNLKEGGTNGLAPGYFLPFEIVSVHLLVVLIGAAYLARAKRRAVSEDRVSLD